MPVQQTLAVRIGEHSLTISGLPTDISSRLEDLLRPFLGGSAATKPALEIQVERLGEEASASQWQAREESGEQHNFSDTNGLITFLEWAAISRTLARTEHHAVFHGAMLARGSATVMLLGASGNGKTTLTLGLMQRGWEPLADDLSLINPTTCGAVAFPRCFHLDDFSASTVSDPTLLTWPGDLPGYARPARWGAGGQPPSAIFLLERCATCPSSRSPITQAQAAGALLTQALRTGLPPARVAQTAAGVASGAKCYTLRNGVLEGALNLIESAS